MFRTGRTVALGSRNAGSCGIPPWLWGMFLLIAVASLVALEYSVRLKEDAYAELRHSIIPIGHNPSLATVKSYPGNLLHFTSNEVSTVPLSDDLFGITVPGSLKLRRVTEYCQWIETWEENENDRGERTRTYYYAKSWVPRPIISVLYDQPARHHNPLRDPTPFQEQYSRRVTVGDIPVSSSLVTALGPEHFRKVSYGPETIASFASSIAAQSHGFKPIGDGYFYSAYQESSAMTFLRIAGMVAEGSFDFQVADLFDQCTAGDIRVHFQSITPAEVSLIARWDSEQLVSKKASNGQSLGLLFPGRWNNPQDMVEHSLQKDAWALWLFRTLLACWAALSLGGYLRYSRQFAFVCSYAGGIWVSIFILIHGFSAGLALIQRNYIIVAILAGIVLYSVNQLRGDLGVQDGPPPLKSVPLRYRDDKLH